MAVANGKLLARPPSMAMLSPQTYINENDPKTMSDCWLEMMQTLSPQSYIHNSSPETMPKEDIKTALASALARNFPKNERDWRRQVPREVSQPASKHGSLAY